MLDTALISVWANAEDRNLFNLEVVNREGLRIDAIENHPATSDGDTLKVLYEAARASISNAQMPDVLNELEQRAAGTYVPPRRGYNASADEPVAVPPRSAR